MLENADYLSFNVKYPIIVDSKVDCKLLSWKNHHVAGQDQTLANISQRFWILRECEGPKGVWEQLLWLYERKNKDRKADHGTFSSNKTQVVIKSILKIISRIWRTIPRRGSKGENRYLSFFICLLSCAVHLGGL